MEVQGETLPAMQVVDSTSSSNAAAAACVRGAEYRAGKLGAVSARVRARTPTVVAADHTVVTST